MTTSKKKRNVRRNVRVIPVRQRWNEDDEDEDEAPYIRASYQPQKPPDGYYSKGKVWTVVVVIAFIYFRFAGG